MEDMSRFELQKEKLVTFNALLSQFQGVAGSHSNMPMDLFMVITFRYKIQENGNPYRFINVISLCWH